MNKDSSIVASAPGKVILFGEHAVVVGQQAIATCVSLRTFCWFHRLQKRIIQLRLPSLGSDGQDVVVSWDVDSVASFGSNHHLERFVLPSLTPEFLAALNELAEKGDGMAHLPAQHKKGPMAFLLLAFIAGVVEPFSCRVWSDLPVGAGLGSSAAFSTSICGALARAAGFSLCSSQCNTQEQPCSTCAEQLNRWAYEAERVLHGNPSGIDNSVAVFGGALSFTRAHGVVRLERVPVLPLLLVDTCVPRSTQQLVSGVLKRKETFPSVMEPAMTAIGQISTRVIELFNSKDAERSELLSSLETLIDMNQGLLECLGVSHPSIRLVINNAQKFHLHTKLTGAGGGGCVYTLLHDDTTAETRAALEQGIRDMGMRCFSIKVGGPGLSIHRDLTPFQAHLVE